MFVTGILLFSGRGQGSPQHPTAIVPEESNVESARVSDFLPVSSRLSDDRGGPGPTIDVEHLLEVWKARQDKCKTYRLEWRETRLDAAGSLSVPGIAQTAPPEDTEFSSDCTLIVDSARSIFRFDGKGWYGRYDPPGQLRVHKWTLAERKYTAVFDGVDAKNLTLRVPGMSEPHGEIRLQKLNPELRNGTIQAVQWFFRPLQREMGGFDPDGIRVLDERETIDGCECIAVLASKRKDDMNSVWRLWIDPKADYVIRRGAMEAGTFTNPTTKTDISYKPDTDLGWVPEKWTRTFWAGNKISMKVTHRMTRHQVGGKVADDDFRVEFPAGTQVRDFRIQPN